MARRAWLGLALAWLLAPAVAEAQQPLFPNLTTHKRARVPSCEENPLYKLYRQQYYGYYPTCWRRFPAGWGCPSPEAPNTAQALADIRKEIERSQREQGGTGDEPKEPGMEAPEPGPAPGTPPAPAGDATIPLPPERSPFEVTPPTGGAAPPARGPTTPERSPFELSPLPDGAVPPGVQGAADPGATELGPPPISAPAASVDDLQPPSPRRTLLGGLFGNFRGMVRR